MIQWNEGKNHYYKKTVFTLVENIILHWWSTDVEHDDVDSSTFRLRSPIDRCRKHIVFYIGPKQATVLENV